MRDKITRGKPGREWEDGIANVPHEFYKLHQFVTLVVDLMFVNQSPFPVTFSRKI